jgi:NADH-quinone oxidoreductase subunit N
MLVINSAIGLFYYLRLILVMAERPSREAPVQVECQEAPTTGAEVTLAVLAALVVWVGIAPSPLLNLLAAMIHRAG